MVWILYPARLSTRCGTPATILARCHECLPPSSCERSGAEEQRANGLSSGRRERPATPRGKIGGYK